MNAWKLHSNEKLCVPINNNLRAFSFNFRCFLRGKEHLVLQNFIKRWGRKWREQKKIVSFLLFKKHVFWLLVSFSLSIYSSVIEKFSCRTHTHTNIRLNFSLEKKTFDLWSKHLLLHHYFIFNHIYKLCS